MLRGDTRGAYPPADAGAHGAPTDAERVSTPTGTAQVAVGLRATKRLLCRKSRGVHRARRALRRAGLRRRRRVRLLRGHPDGAAESAADALAGAELRQRLRAHRGLAELAAHVHQDGRLLRGDGARVRGAGRHLRRRWLRAQRVLRVLRRRARRRGRGQGGGAAGGGGARRPAPARVDAGALRRTSDAAARLLVDAATDVRARAAAAAAPDLPLRPARRGARWVWRPWRRRCRSRRIRP